VKADLVPTISQEAAGLIQLNIQVVFLPVHIHTEDEDSDDIWFCSDRVCSISSRTSAQNAIRITDEQGLTGV